MANFLLSLPITLDHEGFYSNDPLDAGKETFKGISRSKHPEWKGWSIIDKYRKSQGFPGILINFKPLDLLVEDFYLTNFWQPIKGDKISNQQSADSIFDFAVNAGTTTSVKRLQSVIGTNADGILGEHSLLKLNSIDFGHFQAAFTLSKIQHYLDVIEKKPTNKKYLYGWIIRSMSFHN